MPGAFDPLGFPLHEEGASTAAPGLYFVGVHFLRKRNSSLLWGVGEDAAIVAAQIAAALVGLERGPIRGGRRSFTKRIFAIAGGNHQFASAEQLHDRRHEQRPDQRRVDEDPGGEPDPELLDVRAGPGGEREEREHEHERRARHELARARDARVEIAFAVSPVSS